MPWIERIEVEDGFLDGLDLELSPRLNVIIGARGTGKTSLLELMRFALGAPAFTEQAAARAKAQVRAVLGRGRVTLTIRHEDGQSQSVSRTIDFEAEPILQATVLAQNEIEAVGASATGRLHLIDRFLTDDIARRIDEVQRTIRSIAKRIDGAAAELLSLRERLAAIPGHARNLLCCNRSRKRLSSALQRPSRIGNESRNCRPNSNASHSVSS